MKVELFDTFLVREGLEIEGLEGLGRGSGICLSCP